MEDDEDIRDLVVYALKAAGFSCEGFEDGGTFLSGIDRAERLPDLVLLDIMLPGDDGLSILRLLRGRPQYSGIPVILLTAKGGEADKAKGLDMGADDYMVKPFGVTELVARIRAVLRRAGRFSERRSQIAYRNIVMDNERRTVSVDGTGVSLTFREYELLHYLLRNAGIALSRDKLMDAVWGFDYEGESRTVDMHVKTLRQKLGTASEHIKTIRNVGYKMGE